MVNEYLEQHKLFCISLIPEMKLIISLKIFYLDNISPIKKKNLEQHSRG